MTNYFLVLWFSCAQYPPHPYPIPVYLGRYRVEERGTIEVMVLEFNEQGGMTGHVIQEATCWGHRAVKMEKGGPMS